MPYFKLKKNIHAGKISPAYLLYGIESYFIERIKEELILHERNSEVTTYDLDEVPIQDVLNDAETVPFFSDKKLVFAYNPTFLLAKTNRLPFSHDTKQLEHYLKNPPEYTVLVIIAPYEKLDNRKKITKLLMNKATVLESKPIKQYDVKKWIIQIGDVHDVTFTDEAIDTIEHELATDLTILQNEIEKLSHFVGKKGVITAEIVLDLLSVSIENSSLQLADAVMERQLKQAITIYKNLEKLNEDPIAMVALLAFQFRIIFQVKLLKEQGVLDQKILREIKAHPYVIKLATNRSRQFTIKRLEYIMDRLTETDAAIKRGKMEKGIAFELLLYELIEGVKS